MTSGAEKMPSWVVGPTEDVVQALMETLVDPILPLRVTSVSPSEDVQIAVAKQMHPVVLLYNYHHRKQRPELVFLEFANFCRLAIVIRPALIAFMKKMKESNPELLNGDEDFFSVTEKAIKDACDIAVGLDASRDVPNMEGWPISKVAVLLIDSKKENCMLQFGSVTEGAWSVLEKELNDFSITPETPPGNEVGNKRKRDNLKVSTNNTEFLQLGYDTVKDVTGISSSDLVVLETHLTYSLSKEKSSAFFYIMQCPGSFTEHDQVPLKFLVDSVQSPLAEKSTDGSWKTTSAVKFHHMFPYVELISCYLSGCQTKVNSSDKKASEDSYNKSKCDDLSHEQVSSPIDNFDSTEKYGPLRVLETTHVNDMTNSGTDSEDNKMLIPKIKVYHCRRKKKLSMKNAKQLGEALPDLKVEVDSLKSNHTLSDEKVSEDKGHLTYLCNQTGTASIVDQRAHLESKVGHNVEVVNTSDSLRSNHIQIRDEMASGDKGDYVHKCNQIGSTAAENQQVQMEVDCLKSNHTQRSDEKVSGDEGHLTNTCHQTVRASTREQRAQLEAKSKHNVQVQNTEAPFRSKHVQSRDGMLCEDKVDCKHKCSQTQVEAKLEYDSRAETISTSDQLQAEAKFKHDLGAHTISASDQLQDEAHDLGAQTMSASDQLQNALTLLYRERRKLYSRICNMEDTLASCEDNISRVRDGGEVDLARHCITSVISGKLHLLLENGREFQDKDNQQDGNNRKPTGLSEAYLPGKSSCQDLEYTCLRNNWRLPRYLTESSQGKFLSNVVVEGKDFKLHAKGGFESNPSVAREAAAAEMFTIMHKIFLI